MSDMHCRTPSVSAVPTPPCFSKNTKGSHKKAQESQRPIVIFVSFVADLFGYGSTACCATASTDSDEQMIPDRLDLGLHIAAQNIGERTYLHSLVVRREERRHSSTREDLLRISYPLQYPIRPQPLVGELEVGCQIFRCLARRKREVTDYNQSFAFGRRGTERLRANRARGRSGDI